MDAVNFNKLADDSGPPCQVCGAIMIRTGSCYTCPDCGATGGCG